MIYFVEDDAGAFLAWMAAVETRGHTVSALTDADAAFEILQAVSSVQVELVIIDVMLAVADPDTSRFNIERTDDYLETGLRLLDDLSVANPEVFPARAVVLTNTLNPATWRSACEATARYGVPLWSKSEFASPTEFGERVEYYVRARSHLP